MLPQTLRVNGRPHAARTTFEQFNAELFLETPNALGQCGLRNVESVRSASNAAVIKNCDNDAKLTNVHLGLPG